MAILAFQKPDKVLMLEADSQIRKIRISSVGTRFWYYRR